MSGGPECAGNLAGLLGSRDDFASLVVSALGARTVRELGLVTVGALAERFGREEVVCATGGRALFGMSPFRICHDYYLSYLPRDVAPAKSGIRLLQLVSQAIQGVPTGIAAFLSAIARLVITILAALRAEALAIWPTHGLDRHGQQNLFAEHVFQLQPIALVITDLSLSFADVDLVGTLLGFQRPVEQVERAIHVQLDILDAAGAVDIHAASQRRDYADIVYRMLSAMVLTDEFGAALQLQRSELTNVGTEVHRAGKELLIELKLTEF